MRGDVADPTQELRELNALKQNNRKLFDSDPNNAVKLESLKKSIHNYERSTDMASKLESIGLTNTKANNDIIFDALLGAGREVTPDNRTVKTILVGPSGTLKMESIWTILPDGRNYLSTVKLIPIK